MSAISETTVRTFLTLVRVGSFTEAARQLYLSQQAVSKHVAKLEQDLGCTLVHRNRGRLTLTQAGEIYYKAFHKMDGILAQARRDADKVGAGQGNTMSIGQPELLDLQSVYRSVMRGFQEKNPEVKMIYHSAASRTVLDWLEQGKLDVAFALGNELQGRKGLAYVAIDQIREVLAVSADHPKATQEATFLDFRDEPVFFTPSPESGLAEYRLRLESIGFSPDKLIETENLLSSCASVEQMQGVAFLLESCRLLNDKAFRTYPSHQSATLMLVYRKDNKKRAVRRLVEEANQLLKHD